MASSQSADKARRNSNFSAGDKSRFNPDFTQHCIDAIGPNASPRARQIFSSLLTHLHEFAREVELTTDEWMGGQELLNACGRLWTESGGKRNEMHRLSDITGLESLVDEMAHKIMAETGEMPTSSAILGPFWSPNAPWRELGESIIDSPAPGGMITYAHGTVTDSETGKGIPGAVVDIWQASTNGKYDFQDPENQIDNNLRGKFRCDQNGEYNCILLRPTAYSLPTDGPAGEILKMVDRHPMRPAHIHLMISADGYKPCTTQIFPKDDPYLESDTVFAVKDDLVVEFPEYNDPKGKCTNELTLNLTLAPKGSKTAKPIPTQV